MMVHPVCTRPDFTTRNRVLDLLGESGQSTDDAPLRLVVVIQRELVGMRTEPDRVELLRPLPIDPDLDKILCEDLAAQQELVIRLERVDGLFEDRKSTRLNSSHLVISSAVSCLKKKI